MNKLFFLLGIALLAVSCSSDEKQDVPTPPKEHTQYAVNYYITKEEIEKHPLNPDNTQIITIPSTTKQPSGNMGLIIYDSNIKEVGYRSYDMCCPIHWEDSDPLKHQLTIKYPQLLDHFAVYCDIAEGYPISSEFSLLTGNPMGGYALAKKISLVKYNIAKYPDPMLEEEIGKHITNPNYKGE